MCFFHIPGRINPAKRPSFIVDNPRATAYNEGGFLWGRRDIPLSRYRRFAALILLMAAFLLAAPAWAAPAVRVYIPDSALPLSLPQIPEFPNGPVLISGHGNLRRLQ